MGVVAGLSYRVVLKWLWPPLAITLRPVCKIYILVLAIGVLAGLGHEAPQHI